MASKLRQRYKKLYDLFLQHLSFFWRPEEVDLSGKEKNDYDTLTDHQKRLIFENDLFCLSSASGASNSELLVIFGL